MAKESLPIVTCDVCHRSEIVHGVKVEKVEVCLGEVKKTGDLCEDHSGPVREALKILPAPVPRRRRRSFEDSIVQSEDEIPRG